MKKNQKSILVLLAIFVVLLGTTLVVSFSSLLDTQEVIVKSITPVYDENSTVVVDEDNVVFNDKNQVVDYKVVIENIQDYDVKITDIKLTTPTEEFLQYTVEDISKDDILVANSTKELTISLETMGIKGWGRNFADELTANISFEKIAKQEEVVPPVEETLKEEETQPEAPATNIEEVINKAEKIEVNSITNNIIEFKEDIKVEAGKKVAVWIYSNPKFLGYFDVVVTNGIKQIAGLEDALKKAQVETGEHSIVLATEEKEVLGYVNIYINENKELLIEKPQDPTDKEDSTINKPSEDLEEEPKEDETGKVENPYTSDKELVGILCIATCITGVAVIVASKNKLTKYTVFILMISPAFTITNAEEVIEVAIKNNVSFESQNVMKPTGCDVDLDSVTMSNCEDYWKYYENIKNFNILIEKFEIEEYVYKFDVTEEQNGRVIAYVVNSYDNNVCYSPGGNVVQCYDVYLQADGIIYPNTDSSIYFAGMLNLGVIKNLNNFDTSEVTNMYGMFAYAGFVSDDFDLDVSSFDTSNVTDMSLMFSGAGYNSTNFTLDLSNFDTSKVTDMSRMFYDVGFLSETLTLDLSNFDTSKVTDMSYMFYNTGSNSENFTLDVSSFDTSNVTNMSHMFYDTGYNSIKLNTSITIKNPNTCINNIFYGTALQEGAKIQVNYTNETKGIANRMVNSKSDGANIVLGEMVETIEDDGELSIGDEVELNGEYFNVISQTDDTVTLWAQYNLGTDYKQSSVQNGVKFADKYGWEYTPGPKEIDIQTWSTKPKTYVNEYVEYLKEELNDDSVTGDLITLKDLEKLSCTIPSDYASGYYGGWNCFDSPYGWISNDQYWWTRSAISNNSSYVWNVVNNGDLSTNYYDANRGVRPVITISKSSI